MDDLESLVTRFRLIQDRKLCTSPKIFNEIFRGFLEHKRFDLYKASLIWVVENNLGDAFTYLNLSEIVKSEQGVGKAIEVLKTAKERGYHNSKLDEQLSHLEQQACILVPSTVHSENTNLDDICNLMQNENYEKARASIKNGLSTGTPPENIFNLAMDYYNHNDFLRAQVILEEMHTQGKTSTNLVEILGRTYFKQKKELKALSFLEREVAKGNTSTTIIELLVGGHRSKGNESKRIFFLEEAFKRKIISGPIINELGSVYLNLQRFDDAIMVFETGLKQDLASAPLYNKLAIAHSRKGNKKISRKIRQFAIHNGDANPDIYNNLASDYFQSKDYETAIKVLEHGINKNIFDATTLLFLSNNHIRRGNKSQSTRILKEAVRVGCTNAKIFQNLSAYYHQQQRYDDAIRILTIAEEKAQTNIFTYTNHATNLHNLGRNKEAAQKLEECLSLGMYSADLFLKLAEDYRILGRVPESTRVLETAISKGCYQPQIFTALSGLYLLGERAPPNSSNIWGWVENETDELEDDINKNIYFAKATLERAISLGCISEEIYLNLACMLDDDESIKNVLNDAIDKGIKSVAIELLRAGVTKDYTRLLQIPDMFEENPLDADSAWILSEMAQFKIDHSTDPEIIEIERKLYERAREIVAKSNSEFDSENDRSIREFFLKSMVERLHKKRSPSNFPIYGKSSNTVRRMPINFANPGQSFSQDSIIIKDGTKEELNKERRIRDILEKLADEGVRVPTYIDTISGDKTFHYIMTLEDGDTLTDSIRSDRISEEQYFRIMKFMAKVHVLFPIDEIKGQYNLEQKVKQKISRREVDPLFNEDCMPVIKCLQASKNITYNKDSTSANWLVREDGKIVVIDTEDKGLVPYALDLASFLNLDVPFFEFEARLDAVDEYIGFTEEICTQQRRVDRKIGGVWCFKKEYCNAVVYRSIANGSALSYSGLVDDALQIRQTGVLMIDHMGQQNMIPSEHQRNYNAIQVQLQKWVDQHTG